MFVYDASTGKKKTQGEQRASLYHTSNANKCFPSRQISYMLQIKQKNVRKAKKKNT